MFPAEESLQLKDGDGSSEKDEDTSDNVMIKSEARLELKKRVNLIAGISLIVGNMIGSGIFASPRSVARNTKSVGLSLIVWSGCGIIAIFGALSYIELGLMVRKSGRLFLSLAF